MIRIDVAGSERSFSLSEIPPADCRTSYKARDVHVNNETIIRGLQIKRHGVTFSRIRASLEVDGRFRNAIVGKTFNQ